jgi:hypothetical protein
MDFVLTGNSGMQSAGLYKLREEPVWAGMKKNLIDPFEYGGYFLKVYGKEGQLIYSRGFNTLFEEWLTTAEANRETQSWINSITMPYPKDTVTIDLFTRNRKTFRWDTLMNMQIDPQSIFIDRSAMKSNKTVELQNKGATNEKIDFVFIAEGYTAAEEAKFLSDAHRFMDSLFVVPPFDLYRDEFNIRAVFVESQESGTDFSGKGIYRNTALNTGFYTFGSARYLTTPDMKSVRDAVWDVPCDAVFIIVNSDVYGGGGMYNFYAIGTAGNEQTITVFVHEFGHSFAGLGDEYHYDGTYEEFYNPAFEPWEPNITTLKDFDRKWKNMIPAGTPIPTPDEPENINTIGVYEGAGYVPQGIYRPYIHCMMKDLQPFCPVCRHSIVAMIQYMTDKPDPAD